MKELVGVVVVQALNFLVQAHANNAAQRAKIASLVESGQELRISDLGLEETTDSLIENSESLNP